jgi:hypothetical protein
MKVISIHNFISSSGSGTVIYYGSGSGSDLLTSSGSGSGSTSQKVTVPVPVPVPVLQHWCAETYGTWVHVYSAEKIFQIFIWSEIQQQQNYNG